MLLAIDIGNTNLTFGLFQGEKILHKFRLTTSLPRTSDEFGVQIVEQLSHKDVSADDVEDVIICSVVPKIMYSLTSGVKKYLDCDPMIVGNGTKSGIRIGNDKSDGNRSRPCGRCGRCLLFVWRAGVCH